MDKKSSFLSTQIKVVFREKVLNEHPDILQIYTDGSVKGSKTASATTIPSYSLNICTRLPNGSSILTAEIKAIIEALQIVKAKPPLSKKSALSSQTQSQLYS